MARSTVFRKLRIALLLYVLLFVAAGAWISRAATTDWDDTLYVNLYPVNGDGSTAAAAWIEGLDERDFEPIERYLQSEAERYGRRPTRALDITLGPTMEERPPRPPDDANVLQVAAWSLHLRWWAWRATRDDGVPEPDIKLFVQYFAPDDELVLDASLGLEKGLVGVINAFASRSMRGANQVVITHELLHTLGATDKYDPATSLPLVPAGLADPDRVPVYPQPRAEIMAGRIAISPTEARIPGDLARTTIGPLTAAEIGLVR
ncbi:hypothetical protein [Lentisalinibacter orientalis]|uniref:hypothetical protein n=1 Tax=Lentisalinibacter orientalis TaxID=2992241 RepID=UPI00386DA3CB